MEKPPMPPTPEEVPPKETPTNKPERVITDSAGHTNEIEAKLADVLAAAKTSEAKWVENIRALFTGERAAEVRTAFEAGMKVPVDAKFPSEIADVLGIDGLWALHRVLSASRKQTQSTHEEYVESQAAKHEAPTEKIDCEPIIQEFLALVTVFEATYPLADLHAITDLNTEDAQNHSIRAPAKIAHEAIGALLNKLKHHSNISNERCAEMVAIDK